MGKNIKYIGVVANMEKPDAPRVLQRLAQKASLLGIQLMTCDEGKLFGCE